ncbi:MAG TPA: neutral/alkaline non-lysosomal ceramidase N-terminal domain-containing protein [Planctomycetota bacterium]
MRRALLLLLVAGCSTSAPRPAGLTAGASKLKITPEKMSWMTGYGNRNKRAEKVHDELHVRALALGDGRRKIVLVAADILGFPPVMNRAIRAEAKRRHGLDDGDLMLVASHTHGGPAVPERPSPEIFHGLPEADAKEIYDYAGWLQDRVLEAISTSLAAMEPAELRLSRTTATFGMNRRLKNPDGSYKIADNPAGLTDPDVPVLRATSGARTIATVFNYACHCTTLGGIYDYNADWAGPACAKVEAKAGGVALFATGCGADLNPSPRAPGAFDLAEKHGTAIAEAVAAAPPGTPLSGPFRTSYGSVDLPLEKAPPRELLEKGLGAKDVYRQRHSREMLKLLDAGRLPASVALPIQAWHLGDVTIAAIGGETCVEYALRLKKEAGVAMVLGYANEVPCYIPSEGVLAEGGYEAGWSAEFGRTLAAGSILYYGWPTPFAPGVEDKLMRGLRALLKN